MKWTKIINIKGNKYTIQELENMVIEDIKQIVMNEVDLNVKILNVKMVGSYITGKQNENSDLDFLLYYEGDIREDDFFNILHNENLTFFGINIDINPIKIIKRK